MESDEGLFRQEDTTQKRNERRCTGAENRPLMRASGAVTAHNCPQMCWLLRRLRPVRALSLQNGLLRLEPHRDLRVDFARGLALWWIFIDHVPENLLRYTTLQRFAIADAAEVFVLLAGYAAGLVYSK